MLANLKPSALNLYAPSGQPGGFLQLKPVPCTQQQQQQQQGPQQMLSLAACNGAAAAGAAAAGSCAWYNPWEDDVMCVFEWESSETPLALKHGRWDSSKRWIFGGSCVLDSACEDLRATLRALDWKQRMLLELVERTLQLVLVLCCCCLRCLACCCLRVQGDRGQLCVGCLLQ
jgi:hypothetical protein